MKVTKVKKEMDMLHGSLVNKMLLFALPLAVSSVLQQLFNSADIAVVGQFAGSDALAAVGANSSLITLLVGFFSGLSIGANVLIASFLGQGETCEAGKAAHTSIVLALICGIFLMIFGVCFAPSILVAMATPADILDLAVVYLRIYFLGVPFIMIYNFEAAILRSKGDTKHPLLALIMAGIINIILNLIFVVVFQLSIAGVAMATTISNLVSALVLFWILTRENGAFRIEWKKLRLYPYLVKRIATVGLPTGCQSSLYSIANVIVQANMNILGSTAVAGSTVSLNMEVMAYYLLGAFSQTCVTFVSQNYAAGQKERSRRIVWYGWLLAALAEIILNGIFLVFAHPVVAFFTKDAAVAALAIVRMKYLLTFEVLNMTPEVLSGSLRGFGYSVVPALICVLGICGFRIGWIYTVFANAPSFENLVVVYPISWVITSLAVFAAYRIIRKRI